LNRRLRCSPRTGLTLTMQASRASTGCAACTHLATGRWNVGRATVDWGGSPETLKLQRFALSPYDGRRQSAATERRTIGSIRLIGPCSGARVKSAASAVDRAGVAPDTQRFRPRPSALVLRVPWQKTGATLSNCLASSPVPPETTCKQSLSWHSPVSPKFRWMQPYRRFYLDDVMAITKRRFHRPASRTFGWGATSPPGKTQFLQ
jgi:hypothetical protein